MYSCAHNSFTQSICFVASVDLKAIILDKESVLQLFYLPLNGISWEFSMRMLLFCSFYSQMSLLLVLNDEKYEAWKRLCTICLIGQSVETHSKQSNGNNPTTSVSSAFRSFVFIHLMNSQLLESPTICSISVPPTEIKTASQYAQFFCVSFVKQV